VNWKACGHARGQRCHCAARERDQRQAMQRYNAAVRADNREIERGNRRRRRCAEGALERAMLGDLTRARVWVTKLVSAGFDRSDGAAIEQMDCPGIEREMRRLLGLAPSADSAEARS